MVAVKEAVSQGDAAELADIIQAYSDVTDRLKRSHELLRHEVCRLRAELHEKNKELQRRERLAALGEMAAGVAHEIRNPLGGIRLYASLLERDLRDRPRELDLVHRIDVGVRTLESIVGDILAFASGPEPTMERVALTSILESVSIHAAANRESSGAQLQISPTCEGIELVCDPGQMERAVLNLVVNALEAAGHGGTAWIRCESGSGRGISIVVEDDGPGLAPEVAQRVFNPFYTTKDSGTGLGLAIVHRIVEMHGGSVQVGSRAGGGASFSISLPWRSGLDSKED